MTESELQHEIVKHCREHDLLVHHSTDARRDIGVGFPDLVIAGHRNVLFVELKNSHSHRTPEQNHWYYALRAAGAHVALWRPEDWISGHIATILSEL